ncbi:MAG TPA: YihY/virulence factor BrkB family protein [Oligoflexia bacterium]|nr:YihY/virulence factor BrkB family protein [Oligoflexia bacterium]HMR24664.1 YihY/virulence factor BrkB family protein [Oligoflexia bacterium]
MKDKKKISVFKLTVSWKFFAVRFFNEIQKDSILKASAALAYYLTIAVFPAFIFLLGLFSFLGFNKLQNTAIYSIQTLLPGDAKMMFESFIEELTKDGGVALLSFGFAVAVWSASSGLAAVIDQLNVTYKVKEARDFIKTRLTALSLMAVFVLMLLSTFSIIIISENIWSYLQENFAMSWLLLSFLFVVKWLFVFLIICTAFALIYYYGPNVQQKFRFITPGSVLGSFLTIVVTLGLNLYLINFNSFGKVYGSIGGFIVFMFWLNSCGFVLLLGAQLNALLEHFNRDGKRKGQKKLPR